MRFEWDPAKARANLRAHGVAFAEAVTVLDDDFALTRDDRDADDETRFVTLGVSDVGNLLVVGLHVSRTGHHPRYLRLEGEQASEGAL